MPALEYPLELVVAPGHPPMEFYDLDTLLCEIANREGPWVMKRNLEVLKQAGIYERVLIGALVSSPTAESPVKLLSGLIRMADRDALRAAGEPLPGPGPFHLYRGVAGTRRRRRERGFSWTDSIEIARQFATLSPRFVDPAVLEVVVEAEHVLAYIGGEEQEYLVQLPRRVQPRRIECPQPRN